MRHVGIVSLIIGLAFASLARASGAGGRWDRRHGPSTPPVRGAVTWDHMMKSLMRDIRGWAIIVGVVFYGVAAWAQIPDAAAPVRRLYATYGTGAATTASGFRDQDAANLFSRSLLALYRRAAKAGLDYDFFVQGQDFNLAKPLDVTRVDSNRDRATVSATLTTSAAARPAHCWLKPISVASTFAKASPPLFQAA